MGKRSNFKRIERDFYPTPLKAVVPLIPHLGDIKYCEPCAGDYALVNHITELTGEHNCFLASDIEPQSEYVFSADAHGLTKLIIEEFSITHIITNPPWDRKILHPMIEHFSSLCPTWLLFDADWAHTKQSAPYMKYCHKIVSVGRVKWIPDSKMTGKDNCAWYLFDQNADFTGTEFFGRTTHLTPDPE